MAVRRGRVSTHIVLAVVVIVALSSVASALNLSPSPDRKSNYEKKKSFHVRDGISVPMNDTEYLLNSTSPPILLNSNLGGLGPNTTDHYMSLVYGNVARIQNMEGETLPVDLVLWNTTYYDPRSEVDVNGIYDIWYPTVSVYAGTNVTLKGVFVNSETGQRVKLSSFTLSFINLDAWLDGSGCQQVIAGNFADYKTSPDFKSSVKAEKMEDGRTSFMATYMSDSHQAPTSPLVMEPLILGASIAIFYKNVDEIEFTLQVKNLGNLTKDFSGIEHSRRYFFTTIPTELSYGYDILSDSEQEGKSQDKSRGSAWSRLLFLLLFSCCCWCLCCSILGCVVFEFRFGPSLLFKVGVGSERDPPPSGHLHHGGGSPNYRFHN